VSLNPMAAPPGGNRFRVADTSYGHE